LDEDDLAQELWLGVLERMHLYDPSRASVDTFIDRIVRTLSATLVRFHERQKRAGDAQTVSLDQPAKGGNEDAATLGDPLSSADRVRHTNAAEADRAEEIHARADAWASEESQVFRDLLDAGGNVTAVAKARSVTRQRIYRQMERMRKQFEDVDLEP
jgi:DNA-directed RNA polymerase specialized sigma24 family protein